MEQPDDILADPDVSESMLDIPESELSEVTEGGDNLRILYVTLIIVVVILIVWIGVVMFSSEEIITILSEMQDVKTNLDPASDHIML